MGDPHDSPPDRSSTTTAGGIAGLHPARKPRPLLVAPTTADDFNALRFVLLPIACWRLEDLRFDIDSSFVRPEAAAELSAFATLRAAHPGAPASIFGHADPVGDDDYNKKLSGRRALAVYALLLRDADRWERLYRDALGTDDWGARAIQMMVRTLGFDPGEIDGKIGPKTKSAVSAYQEKKGLAADGNAGKATRKALFLDYMDAICQDDAGVPYKLDPSADFLAKGADPSLKGDVQGCSEFNLVRVFSKDEDAELSKKENRIHRNAENLPNRRVLIFLFPPGAKLDPSMWPCPAAEEGAADCKAQFWPDGDARRSPKDERRSYAKDKDTMACRFYDRMARRSPCEMARSALRLRLLNSENSFIPNAPYRLKLAGEKGEVREGKATADGWLVEQNVPTPAGVTIEWGYPTEFGISDEERATRWAFAGPYGYTLDVLLYTEDGASDEDKARRHLHNLGFPPQRSFEENLLYFQRDYEVYPADGALNDDTKKALAFADDKGLSREEFIKRWPNEGGGGSSS